MKKVLMFICLLLLVVPFVAMGQGTTTMTIGSVEATAAGAAVSVPITVENFSSVGSITLKVAYDATVATFVNVANAPSGLVANAAGGVITLIWYDASGNTPISIVNGGKLVDLNFTYIAGTSAVTFTSAQCEITNATGGPISSVSYVNGSITSNTNIKMTIGSVTASAPGAISVPVTVKNFTSVGSVTLKIAYDQTVATFVNVTNAPAGLVANAAGGVITLIWYDASGNTPLTIASGGKLVDLNFTYIAGTSAVAFNTAQCEVTNSTGGAISNVGFINGNIAPTPKALSIGAVTASRAGAAVSVPITVGNFLSVGSITLKIAYDPAVVTYVGVANAPVGVNFVANAASGVITLIWYDASGNTPISIADGGKLVDLNFTYLAGSGNVSFNTAQCEVTNATGGAISGTTYNNGSITFVQNLKPTITAIPAITKGEKDTVSFVVSATDPNVGDVLTYSASGLPTGATFTAATRTFLWVPSLGQNGSYTVKFLVTDGDLKDSTNAVITITKNNVKPTIAAIPAVTKAALDTVSFVVSATDPNPGDVLTYSASGLPTGATFTPATRTFVWVPTLAQGGSAYTVKFLVSDGQLKDSTNAVITISKLPLVVKNVIADKTLNDAPITNRTVKIKLTSPVVFANNIGTLTYTVTSGNAAYVTASIIAPDTLKIQGLRTTPTDVSIRITLTGTDTDARTISTSFMVVVTGPTDVAEVPNVPTEFSLSQNYPNPFNPSTSIKFGLPSQAPVTMEIYNMLGVKVRTLIQGKVMSAGIHQMEWNGKDDAGVSVTSGVYLYRINAGAFQVTKKMMMLK